MYTFVCLSLLHVQEREKELTNVYSYKSTNPITKALLYALI
jgi:hypothetical protein